MKAISKRSVLAHEELQHTLAEARILRRFAVDDPDNPFIAKIHHSFTDRENFYIVMDFYPGGDLATQMERDVLGHLRTRFYAVDIAQGLEDLWVQSLRLRSPQASTWHHRPGFEAREYSVESQRSCSPR